MFIIPVGNRVDWKRPPIVTLLLILVNFCVFFFLQNGGDFNDDKATDYYFTTELPTWELPRYAAYLEESSNFKKNRKFEALLAEENPSALWIMEQDEKFMVELRAEHIITSQDMEFVAWSEQRAQYESMASFTSRYVFRVNEPSLLTALTSAFMHAGIGHLLGNMVVLFLVGFLVE